VLDQRYASPHQPSRRTVKSAGCNASVRNNASTSLSTFGRSGSMSSPRRFRQWGVIQRSEFRRRRSHRSSCASFARAHQARSRPPPGLEEAPLPLRRAAPTLAKIPPPAQFALTFLVGVGLDRLTPWRKARMAAASVHWAGFALAVAGSSLAAAAAGRFVLRRTTLRAGVSGGQRHAWLVARSNVSVLDRRLSRFGARASGEPGRWPWP